MHIHSKRRKIECEKNYHRGKETWEFQHLAIENIKENENRENLR